MTHFYSYFVDSTEETNASDEFYICEWNKKSIIYYKNISKQNNYGVKYKKIYAIIFCIYLTFILITISLPAWNLLKSKNKAIKVVIAIWGEQDVQAIARAFHLRRQLIPTKPANHRGVQIIAITYLNIVITTAMVRFQTEQKKPTQSPQTNYV